MNRLGQTPKVRKTHYPHTGFFGPFKGGHNDSQQECYYRDYDKQFYQRETFF
jgi:hypothetical protein